jgi:peptide/nickel transport system substrate-binding protein
MTSWKSRNVTAKAVSSSRRVVPRRDVLKAGLSTASVLATPYVARADAIATFRHIPEADLAVLDPVWTTANVTRNHAFMVFDTLYGMDEAFTVQPQMVEAHSVEADTLWTLRLRSGLMFHDGQPVLARDAVASIRRWATRSPFGQSLMEAADEIAAPDDQTITLRMKRRFPVTRALANSALIMPERLATTAPDKQVSEMVGSGPFRFLADERVAGARVAYARFDGYVPREGSKPSFTAGPKTAYVPRVEWNVIPDMATASAAMLAGEADSWGPSADLLAQLAASPRLRLEMIDTLGGTAVLRFNHLHPPFDNAAIRRAILGVIDQAEFMTAVSGTDRTLWRDHVGVFTPGGPMANDAGMAVLTGPRDFARARADLTEAGYKGEPVVLMNPGDLPNVSALALLGADVLTRAGMTVDLQTMDWGTLIQRRSKQAPPSQGGWNVVFTSLNGSGTMDPADHLGIRGNGLKAWPGWPTSPALESLRNAWFDTADLAAQQAICAQIQQQVWQDVPYIPLGQSFGPYAFNRRVTDVVKGFPLFYGLKI